MIKSLIFRSKDFFAMYLRIFVDVILNKPKIIVLKLDGGVGSNILQYALGRQIESKTKFRVLYDKTWYGENNEGRLTCDGSHKYTFIMDKVFPKMKLSFINRSQSILFKRYFGKSNYKIWKYDPHLFLSSFYKHRITYLDGYYSNWKYWLYAFQSCKNEFEFSEILIDDKNKLVVNKIANSKYPVSVHIRRGDFLKMGWDILSNDYYINAINFVKQYSDFEPHFYFFSNDIDYITKEIIPKLSHIIYSVVNINDQSNGYLDMYLMSKCKSQIIANSTFSMCAAFMAQNVNLKNGVVIAPDTWGYNIKNDGSNLDFEGISDSIRAKDWIILDHTTGKIIT